MLRGGFDSLLLGNAYYGPVQLFTDTVLNQDINAKTVLFVKANPLDPDFTITGDTWRISATDTIHIGLGVTLFATGLSGHSGAAGGAGGVGSQATSKSLGGGTSGGAGGVTTSGSFGVSAEIVSANGGSGGQTTGGYGVRFGGLFGGSTLGAGFVFPFINSHFAMTTGHVIRNGGITILNGGGGGGGGAGDGATGGGGGAGGGVLILMAPNIIVDGTISANGGHGGAGLSGGGGAGGGGGRIILIYNQLLGSGTITANGGDGGAGQGGAANLGGVGGDGGVIQKFASSVELVSPLINIAGSPGATGAHG